MHHRNKPYTAPSNAHVPSAGALEDEDSPDNADCYYDDSLENETLQTELEYQ